MTRLPEIKPTTLPESSRTSPLKGISNFAIRGMLQRQGQERAVEERNWRDMQAYVQAFDKTSSASLDKITNPTIEKMIHSVMEDTTGEVAPLMDDYRGNFLKINDTYNKGKREINNIAKYYKALDGAYNDSLENIQKAYGEDQFGVAKKIEELDTVLEQAIKGGNVDSFMKGTYDLSLIQPESTGFNLVMDLKKDLWKNKNAVSEQQVENYMVRISNEHSKGNITPHQAAALNEDATLLKEQARQNEQTRQSKELGIKTQKQLIEERRRKTKEAGSKEKSEEYSFRDKVTYKDKAGKTSVIDIPDSYGIGKDGSWSVGLGARNETTLEYAQGKAQEVTPSVRNSEEWKSQLAEYGEELKQEKINNLIESAGGDKFEENVDNLFKSSEDRKELKKRVKAAKEVKGKKKIVADFIKEKIGTITESPESQSTDIPEGAGDSFNPNLLKTLKEKEAGVPPTNTGTETPPSKQGTQSYLDMIKSNL